MITKIHQLSCERLAMKSLILKSDCKKILLQEIGLTSCTIKEFEVTSAGSFLGYLGEYFYLKIIIESEEKSSILTYFVKSLPISNQSERKIIEEQGIFKKESQCYVTIFPKLLKFIRNSDDKWCPSLYLAKDDVLVLENLSEKRYRTMPFRYMFNQKHVEETLKALARFHSCSIQYEKESGKKIGNEFQHVFQEKSFVISNLWLHVGFRSIMMVAKQFTKYSKSHQEYFDKSFYKKLFQFFDRTECSENNGIQVLVHRDLWKNNMMFRFAQDSDLDYPEHCVLLDFQIARYLPLSIDVVMGIIMNTRKEHHEKFMDYYLQFYYNYLKEKLAKENIDLKTLMTFDVFTESCKYFKLFALIFNAIARMIIHIPSEYYAGLSIEDYDMFTNKNRNSFIEKFMNEDPVYHDYIVEAVEELIEDLFEI